MPESLLSPSGIKLYGRIVTDIFTWPAARAVAVEAGVAAAEWDRQVPRPSYSGLGHNLFLQHQLQSDDCQLARIYGFSFEGRNYDLPKPAIFLVHTNGAPVDLPQHDRSDVDTSGVIARDWEFASTVGGDGADLRYWEYDKGDFSIRLDIETGPFEQILLEAALRGGPAAASGANLMSGANLRIGRDDKR